MMVSSFTDAGSIKSFPAVVADHPTKCYHFPLFFRGLIEAKRTEGMNYIKPAAMIPVDTTVSSSFGKRGGSNLSDKGLNLSGSWQQGHSATTIPVGVFKSSAKILPRSVVIIIQGGRAALPRADLASDACLWGEAPTELERAVPSPSPADTRRSLATLAAQAAANSRRVELGPRAQPSSQSFSEVTDPFCRLPLPTLFHRPEAVHLGDLMRL
ncbi:hypothetical protein Bca4012_102564 [Brassica carinata]